MRAWCGTPGARELLRLLSTPDVDTPPADGPLWPLHIDDPVTREYSGALDACMSGAGLRGNMYIML
jgi:hypothetical protein